MLYILAAAVVALFVIMDATTTPDAHPARPYSPHNATPGREPARPAGSIRRALFDLSHPYRNPYRFRPYPQPRERPADLMQPRRPSNPVAHQARARPCRFR